MDSNSFKPFHFEITIEMMQAKDFAEMKRTFAQAYIDHCFEMCGNNNRKTGRLLKLDPKTVYRIRHGYYKRYFLHLG